MYAVCIVRLLLGKVVAVLYNKGIIQHRCYMYIARVLCGMGVIYSKVFYSKGVIYVCKGVI